MFVIVILAYSLVSIDKQKCSLCLTITAPRSQTCIDISKLDVTANLKIFLHFSNVYVY